jgi:hypothetical protein
VALAPTGCGDDGGEAPSTPATLVPASAQLYAEALLRPEGESRTAIESPLAALLDTDDPGAVIVDELDRRIAEAGSDLTYEDDVEPWLGERGAVFFNSLYGDGKDGADGAFVVEATDPDAAGEFADKVEAEEGQVDEGDAVEVVGDALVFGSRAGVDAVAATEAGGESLADDPGFDAVLGADAGAEARAYLDTPALVESATDAGELSDSDRRALGSVFGAAIDEPIAAVLDAQTTGVGLEVSYGANDAPLLAAAGESKLLRELPGDAWLAAGFVDAGEAIGSLLGSAEDFGIAPDELEATKERFRREYGLELADVYGPLGDGALFANGAGIFGAGGGLVFESDDEDAAKRLVDGLERAAKRGGEEVRSLSGPNGETGFSVDAAGAPGAINFVATPDRFVVAYGESATAAALDPGHAEGNLGESQAFGDAVAALGEDYDVTAYLDFGPVADLLELVAATAPSLDAALPYLESLDFVIAGSSSDGERERQRIFVGIAGITVEPTA